MLHWNNNELLTQENIIRTFFEKVAGQKEVIIGHTKYTMPLNYQTDNETVIINDKLPVLNLKNKNLEQFEKALTAFVKTFFESERNWANPIISCQNQEDKLIFALYSVWLNLTFDDYENPIRYLNRFTNFLKDKTFGEFYSGKTIKKMQTLQNCDIEIKLSEQKEFQETPTAISLIVKKGKAEKRLPRIAYGISDGTAFIYGIQGYNEKDESPDIKRVNRQRYKINETERLPKDYVNLYLKQEPYAYMSLFVFLSMLKQKGIDRVEMLAYLPQRYETKEKRLEAEIDELEKEILGEQLKAKEKREQLRRVEQEVNNHQRIQYNITNKFLAYMSRMTCDIPGIEMIETPDENNSGLVVDISQMKVTKEENIIFYELYRKIEEIMRQKKLEEGR